MIIQLFNHKKGRYGIRRIKMHLKRKFGVEINLKKIIRIKKKFGLVTVVRRRSKYRAVFRAGEEHTVAPNLLQRNFNPTKEEVFLSTDVTELRYSNSQKAYLSAIKDLGSKEIVCFNVSSKPTIDLVIKGLDELFESMPNKKRRNVIVHSDQGFHYTSHQFRKKLADYGIKQSMSRKGNCLDNAPIESFFGHLKDEADYEACKSVNEVRKKIKSYIKYYNYQRPQWGLKQKTPAEARV